MQPGVDEIDYRETADVTRVHGAVKREHSEPEVATFPVPLWLIGVVIAVTACAFFYFGQFNGGFSATVFNPNEGVSRGGKGGGPGEGAAAGPVELTLAQQGEKVYKSNCITCHQGDGMGNVNYPQLAESEWVNGPSKRVAMVVLKGLQGELTIHGKTFNGAMPAWGGTLNDKKIAGVLSYIRSAWGNTAGEITPEQVAALRKELADRAEPFTQPELEGISEDLPPAGGQ